MNSTGLPRRSAALGLLFSLLGCPLGAEAFPPIRPVPPRRPIPPRPHAPGSNLFHTRPGSAFKYKLPGGSAESAPPPPPRTTWYHPAGMDLTDVELAKAERVHSVYRSTVTEIQVDTASTISVASQRTSAEQLLVRVLHRGIEKAMRGMESYGSRVDPDAATEQLIAALRTSDGQTLQDANAGVWTKVLQRDFGGVEYQVVVKEPWWIKKLWDSSLKVEVASPNLPLATTVIDGSVFGKAVGTA